MTMAARDAEREGVCIMYHTGGIAWIGVFGTYG
jgi:hypothetical protein